MSNPDTSDAVYICDIPAERPWSRVLKKGQTLRIIDTRVSRRSTLCFIAPTI
jgi:hypothetical protein